MKKFIIVIMVSHFFTSCSTTMNQAVYDKQSKTKMLVGMSNRGGLQQDPFVIWFNKEYGAYALNKEAVQVLIYWILDAADFDESRLTLINVDREKKSPDGEEKGLNIHHVPTLILYKNRSEIGRVIELPIQSLEEDMAAIINGEKYTPNHSDYGAN